MEYVKGISLRDYYQRCHRRICEKACKRIFYQLCDAMSFYIVIIWPIEI